MTAIAETDAKDITTVLRWAMGLPGPAGQVTDEDATAAAQRLAARAGKALMAGLRPEQVTLSRQQITPAPAGPELGPAQRAALRRAITEPGSVLPRAHEADGLPVHEMITDWRARAVELLVRSWLAATGSQIQAEGGPHPGGHTAASWARPLPELLLAVGGWYVQVSAAALPPLPGTAPAASSAGYRWQAGTATADQLLDAIADRSGLPPGEVLAGIWIINSPEESGHG